MAETPPTHAQIIRAATEAIKNELKRIAQDASLYQLYGIRTPKTIYCYDKKRALTAALERMSTLYDPPN